jgi:hypothetical protein
MEDDLRDDAVDVLRDALVWRLTTGQWTAVTQAVDVLAAALVAGDASLFREALYDLELAGPVRATRIEDAEVLPPPEPVRERVNELIHTLDGRPVDPQSTDDAAAGAAG